MSLRKDKQRDGRGESSACNCYACCFNACLLWIWASSHTGIGQGWEEGKKKGRMVEGRQGREMMITASNLGYEWAVTSQCSATQWPASRKNRAGALLTCDQSEAVHCSGEWGENWLKVLDHKLSYWFWGQRRGMRSWNKYINISNIFHTHRIYPDSNTYIINLIKPNI